MSSFIKFQLSLLTLVIAVSCNRFDDENGTQDENGVQIEVLMKLSALQLQGAACYGDYLFQFTAQNVHGLIIADLKQKKEIGSIDLEYDINSHNSHASFGAERYKEDDYFPLLYVSENYAPNSYYKIHVYRVICDTATDLPVGLELVQLINMPPLPYLDDMQYPHGIVDVLNNAIWIEGYSSDSKKILYKRFDLPPFSEDPEIELSRDIKDTFEINKNHSTDQSICIYQHHLYQIVGFENDAQLIVINLQNKEIEKIIVFNGYNIYEEPEGVFVWDNSVCISFANTYIYRILNL